MKKHIIFDHKVILYRNSIHIEKSYNVDSVSDMRTVLECARKLASQLYGYNYKRTTDSWVKEWKAHNLLYLLGIKRDSTRDVDLNEDESKKRRFAYAVLSSFYFCKK